MQTEREQSVHGGEEQPRGAGWWGIKRGTWILGLCARDVSSRRGNCVLKKIKKKKKKKELRRMIPWVYWMKIYDSHNGHAAVPGRVNSNVWFLLD